MLKVNSLRLLISAAMLCVTGSSFAASSTVSATFSTFNSGVTSSQVVDDKTDKAKARADFIRKNYSKFEYRIPARDGKLLFTSVYIPNDASAKNTYPVLIVRTPYSVAPYGAGQYKTMLGPTADYEKEGFIFVFQDVRGAYMSEGDFVNMRPHIDHKTSNKDTDESSDTYDTIEWLLKKLSFNNGKVGQWGISYPGFYTSAGAIDSHPALKAISPQAPIADWFRGDDMHRNGAFNLQLAFGFFSGFGKPRPQPTDKDPDYQFNYGTPDAYQFYMNLGGLSNVNTKYFKGEIPFWNETSQHPNYDQFWQSKNILPHLKQIKAAVLTVGGWFDTEDLYGPLHTFQAIEKQNPGLHNNLIIGPWIHGGWTRTEGDKIGDTDFGFKTSETYQPIELAFFKHYLKDGANPSLPKARVFETGANRWRNFDAWPPRDAQASTLYFQINGKLSTSPPSQPGTQFDEYLSDPAKPVPYTTEIATHWSNQYVAADQRFASRRPDVLSYETEVLQNDMTLAGPLEAELFISSSATDADFIVKLIDVYPDDMVAKDGEVNRGGQQTLVRGEPFRARFRDGFETAKPLVPNEVSKVRFAMNDVLHTFQRGHRIMVQVQSSWFPFIDRNPQNFVPNIYEAKDSDFIKATHRVYRNEGEASALHIHVLPALDQR